MAHEMLLHESWKGTNSWKNLRFSELIDESAVLMHSKARFQPLELGNRHR